MKKSLILLSGLLVVSTTLLGWGFWGHQRINHMAVFCLPPEMVGFYKKNIDFVTEHSVDPDKRRYSDKEEAPRHYIDIDHFGTHPFDSMPRAWRDAVARYSEDTLKAYGIVPWHIQIMLSRLTEAFKNKEQDQILKMSAELGHYVADAHVPLHTTENYNGQLSNQKGIHGFWESRLPELFGEDYDFFVGRAVYVKKPLEDSWRIVRESNAALDSVLRFEAELNKRFPEDKKYTYEQRGKNNVKIYSEEYSSEYHKMLSGMVERRMQAATLAVASYWYTAWVNAGKPDLGDQENAVQMDSLRAQVKREAEKMRQDRVNGAVKGHEE